MAEDTGKRRYLGETAKEDTIGGTEGLKRRNLVRSSLLHSSPCSMTVF